MRKSLIFILFSSLLGLLGPTYPSSAVEFGQVATGDPNAVKVGGASGFLYSERIVLTVAHVIESTGGIDYWEQAGVIYTPGISQIAGERKYKVKKVLIPETFSRPDYVKGVQAVDDLAIIILSEDMPVTKKALLATEDQMKQFVKKQSKVELVGYGITNGSQRNSAWADVINRAPNKLTSTLISPESVIDFYKQYPNGLPPLYKLQTGNYGIVQHREKGESHLCDGDSGSAFFVEEDGIRYVLGMTGQGVINNNCPPPVGWYGAPSMSWVNPAFKLSELIKAAEKIVYEDKKRESTAIEESPIAAKSVAKQEAEAKSKADVDAKEKIPPVKKMTITCIKGKISKRVTGSNPKCPAAYKKQ